MLLQDKTKGQIKKIKDKLNEQQQRFCEAKLFNNNVQAYMIAYPECKYKSAATSANRLLEDENILDYIEVLKGDIENITGVSKIRNIAELSKIAYSSIADLHDTWITLTEFNKLTPEQKAAIESIDTKTEHKLFNDQDIVVNYVKVKLYSKNAAIETINKMMGYNAADKVDLTSLGKSIQYQNVSKQFPDAD